MDSYENQTDEERERIFREQMAMDSYLIFRKCLGLDKSVYEEPIGHPIRVVKDQYLPPR